MDLSLFDDSVGVFHTTREMVYVRVWLRILYSKNNKEQRLQNIHEMLVCEKFIF